MWVLLGCNRSDDRVEAGCRDLDVLQTAEVQVVIGSRLGGNGELSAGQVGHCARSPAAAAMFRTLLGLLPAMPAELRPSRVVVHHAPQLPAGARLLLDLELHRPSGTLIAAGGSVPAAVWFHELAHVRMVGKRPAAPVARRISDAIEEGIADFAAATVIGSPQLPGRSLDAPPQIVADDWAALATDSFDPHRLGWQFAASLWQTQPARAVLEDLIRCMAATPPSTADERTSVVIATWLASCPQRSRATITERVCLWLPDELVPTCR